MKSKRVIGRAREGNVWGAIEHTIRAWERRHFSQFGERMPPEGEGLGYGLR
jgi:hypothetical protein